MVLADCVRCSMNMRIDPSCPTCKGSGSKPPTERQIQEMRFRAEEILETPKPDDAQIH